MQCEKQRTTRTSTKGNSIIETVLQQSVWGSSFFCFFFLSLGPAHRSVARTEAHASQWDRFPEHF